MKTDIKFTVYLQPGAKKSELCGKHGDFIKIKVHSPPIDGKANEALIHFLSEMLSISRSLISISSGQKSRFKTICIKNCDAECEIKIKKIFT